MTGTRLSIRATGMVSSVGLTAEACCAAIRGKLSAPRPTDFYDRFGERIVGHPVDLGEPLRGRPRLARMAAIAIDDCLSRARLTDPGASPLVLCVSEAGRQGRLPGIDDRLFLEIEQACGIRFADDSLVVSEGRVGHAVALREARRLLEARPGRPVLIAGVDSLLDGPALDAFVLADRILTQANPNGFMPGEAAACVCVVDDGAGAVPACLGIGLAHERAILGSDLPLRAEGLAAAIKASLSDAGMAMHEIGFRLTDISGEEYYFKEAALALSRTLRQRRETFDLWHPAECTGETGAASGVVMLCVADAALRKGYAPGRSVICHAGTDPGRRSAVVVGFEGTTSGTR